MQSCVSRISNQTLRKRTELEGWGKEKEREGVCVWGDFSVGERKRERERKQEEGRAVCVFVFAEVSACVRACALLQ